MSVNGVSNSTTPSYQTAKTDTKAASSSKTDTKVSSEAKNDSAAVYEPGKGASSGNKIYKQNSALVSQLKADSERRGQQLQDLVTKLLTKQGQKVDAATNIYQLLREGKVKVDPQTAAQAKADIADDGYWGVNQTSDRMVSFAKALTGGDPSKADKMLEAFKKGFEQAKKAWGGELPDLCQRTYDATIQKFEDWKNSNSDSSSMESQAADQIKNQAAADGIAR